ncbi:hypothetical protein ACWGH5_39085 [Streptomyces sp. NPDC054864]
MADESERDVRAAIDGEMRLLDPEVRASPDRVLEMLDPGWTEIGASGTPVGCGVNYHGDEQWLGVRGVSGRGQ